MSEFFDEYGEPVDETGEQISYDPSAVEFTEHFREPAFANELTQMVGPVRMPQTSDEFLAANDTIMAAQNAVAQSPGAAQYLSEQSRAGVEAVVGRVSSLAEEMGGRVHDAPAAYTDANELYDAAIRAGDTPEMAQRFSIEQAAKKATGKLTYKDISERFQKRTFGQTIEPQRKRSP